MRVGERAVVRPLVEDDLVEADRVFRMAFGTFLGAREPQDLFANVDFVSTRWRANPSAAFAAEVDGRIVGSIFAANWGSVGFLGPLTVDPELWDRRIAQQLLGSTMDLFDGWGTGNVGLFTFSQSPKHIALYQKFGFWPRFITSIMTKPVEAPIEREGWSTISDRGSRGLTKAVAEVHALTDAIYPGLDVSIEVTSVAAQGLGDTILLEDESGLAGFAVCHIGSGTEAGSGACYVKVGAVRSGPDAELRFARLLDACGVLAAERERTMVVAGVNAGRERAWRVLTEQGYRTSMQGIAMQRPNEPAYNTRDTFLIDDWR